LAKRYPWPLLKKVKKTAKVFVDYLEDGSMVVVNRFADMLGSTVLAEVESIIPTSVGRMVFGKLVGEDR
jgi:uncharacterized protein YacL